MLENLEQNIDKICPGMDFPLCPKKVCGGFLRPVKSNVAFARCPDCGKFYDSRELLLGWLNNNWIHPDFCRIVLKTIISNIKIKNEGDGEPIS
ncbi:MAG: hypothetical protein GF317_20760 [Candidatus Lokiarchaeota archaeon]|nr:hypothetical protein [Candidatus Lokiarchaeota archaeon]